MAKRTNAVLKIWKARSLSAENPYALGLDLDDLLPLITSKTRIVAFTACSNILGSILPIKDIVKGIREDAAAKTASNVLISLDCVAYAPHKRMDVQDWDVDFCVMSYYKVFLIPKMYLHKFTAHCG
jgi:selenocysteine lyase/cysteine desulfurase